MKLAMVKMSECLPAGSQLQACVHDEVIFYRTRRNCKHTLRLAQKAMIEVFTKLFPNMPIEAIRLDSRSG